MTLLRCPIAALPPDRDDRIRLALAEAGVSGDLGRIDRSKGKPVLADRPEVFFSVSHSGDWWVCAVADRPVGVDIQRHTDCDGMRLAKRFYHKDEWEWLRSKDPLSFFTLWTVKEAAAKCDGLGIAQAFRKRSVIREGALELEGYDLQFPPAPEGYTLAVAVRED